MDRFSAKVNPIPVTACRAVLSFAISLLVLASKGQDHWFMSVTPGFSITLPAPLTIVQEKYEKISILAEYRSVPLKRPPYYSVCAGFGGEKGSWELEMNHLKLYLKNKPRLIDNFSISHGFNQVFINRQIVKGRTSRKIGAGIVVAHPESTIRGYELDENGGMFGKGYYIAGPAAQYAICHEIPVKGVLCLLAEVKISVGYASVPVAGGRAQVPAWAAALLIGPMLKTGKRP